MIKKVDIRKLSLRKGEERNRNSSSALMFHHDEEKRESLSRHPALLVRLVRDALVLVPLFET